MHVCLVSHTEPDVWDGGLHTIGHLLVPYLDLLAPGDVDIFHIHFHLYGFGSSTRSPWERMARAAAILQVMASDRRVRFSTLSEAVADWQAWQGGQTA